MRRAGDMQHRCGALLAGGSAQEVCFIANHEQGIASLYHTRAPMPARLSQPAPRALRSCCRGRRAHLVAMETALAMAVRPCDSMVVHSEEL